MEKKVAKVVEVEKVVEVVKNTLNALLDDNSILNWNVTMKKVIHESVVPGRVTKLIVYGKAYNMDYMVSMVIIKENKIITNNMDSEESNEHSVSYEEIVTLQNSYVEIHKNKESVKYEYTIVMGEDGKVKLYPAL